MRAGSVEPLVLCEGLQRSYRSGEVEQRVLAGLSLHVLAGEFVALLGASGSGKTTVLNLVGGLDRPDGGSLESCGVDLISASAGELTRYRAASVGFVFQFYNLLPTLTARENVEAGLAVVGVTGAPARERAHSFLERVGLGPAADKFPGQLSGGEQQRVAIARALAKEPRLVLADEPTGNLDAEAGAAVLALLRELNAATDVSLLVATHDPVVAAAAGRVCRLAEGRLVEETPA